MLVCPLVASSAGPRDLSRLHRFSTWRPDSNACPASPRGRRPPRNVQCSGENCAHTDPTKRLAQPKSVFPGSSRHRLLEMSSSGSPARSGPSLWGCLASILHKPDKLLTINRTTYSLPTLPPNPKQSARRGRGLIPIKLDLSIST